MARKGMIPLSLAISNIKKGLSLVLLGCVRFRLHATSPGNSFETFQFKLMKTSLDMSLVQVGH